MSLRCRAAAAMVEAGNCGERSGGRSSGARSIAIFASLPLSPPLLSPALFRCVHHCFQLMLHLSHEIPRAYASSPHQQQHPHPSSPSCLAGPLRVDVNGDVFVPDLFAWNLPCLVNTAAKLSQVL